MKAILWKEFRENNAWAALGLVLIAIANAYGHYLNREVNSAVTTAAQASIVAYSSLVLGPVLGVLLGSLQTVPELKRDQWAFLVHRPFTLGDLFRGKTAAGLIMLAAAIFPPDFAMFFWLKSHSPTPDLVGWNLLLCSFLAFTWSALLYFAAIVAAMRPGKWHASKLLSLAAVIPLIAYSFMALHSWQIVGALAGAIAILVYTAWECFRTRGDYLQMSPSGRFTLGVTLFTGSGVVLCALAALIGLVVNVTYDRMRSHEWKRQREEVRAVRSADGTLTFPQNISYEIDKQGRVMSVTSLVIRKRNEDRTTLYMSGVTVPDGQHITYPPSKKYEEHFLRFTALSNDGDSVYSQDFPSVVAPYLYSQSSDCIISNNKYQFTFYNTRQRRVVYYSIKEKRITGYLGPGGYYDANGPAPAEGANFPSGLLSRPNNRYYWFPQQIYAIDSAEKKVSVVMQTPPDESIRSVVSVSDTNPKRKTVGPQLCVITDKKIQFYDGMGALLSTTPLDGERSGTTIQAAFLPDGQKRFWMANVEENGSGWHKLKSHILEARSDGSISRRYDLPTLPLNRADAIVPGDCLLTVVLPCFRQNVATFENQTTVRNDLYYLPTDGVIFGKSYPCGPRAVPIIVPIFASLFAGLLAYGMALRCGMPVAGRILWAIIAMPFGLVGVCGLLSLRDWPLRLTCTSCGKARVAGRDNCEHCGAAWPAPAADGTEIFQDALPVMVRAQRRLKGA